MVNSTEDGYMLGKQSHGRFYRLVVNGGIDCQGQIWLAKATERTLKRGSNEVPGKAAACDRPFFNRRVAIKLIAVPAPRTQLTYRGTARLFRGCVSSRNDACRQRYDVEMGMQKTRIRSMESA